MVFSEIESGYSVEQTPIATYKNNMTADRYCYMIAGVHGDEYEGVYVLQQIFEFLKDNEDVIEVPMIIIPVLNVDGYKDQSRVNSHGVDLNRNLGTSNWSPESKKPKHNPGKAPGSEPETQALMSLLKEYPPGFVISFHSGKPILNYDGNAEAIAKFLSAYNQYPLKTDRKPLKGSLGHYLDTVMDVPSITFECPKLTDEKSLIDIWEENQTAFEKLFSSEMIKCSL